MRRQGPVEVEILEDAVAYGMDNTRMGKAKEQDQSV
jgi:hypothetical protein